MTLVEEPDRPFDVLVLGHNCSDFTPVEFGVRFKATTRLMYHDLELQRERETAAKLSHPLWVVVVHLDIERSHHQVTTFQIEGVGPARRIWRIE